MTIDAVIPGCLEMKFNDMGTQFTNSLDTNVLILANAVTEVKAVSTASSESPAQQQFKDMTCIGQRRKQNGELLSWRVNIARRGVRIDRNFSVFSYGTSAIALQAAMAFRDEVLERVKPLSLAEYCTIVKSHNTSGIPGVRRTNDGSWRMRLKLPDGREASRLFSVTRHGEQGAFELAIQARAEALESVQDLPVHHRGNKQPARQKTIPAGQDYELSRPSYVQLPDPNPYFKERTNIPGVMNFSIPYVRTNGENTIKHYKLARYREPGHKLKQRYFSVQEHGEEEALRLANEQRKAWEIEALSRQNDNQAMAHNGAQTNAAAIRTC